MSLSISFIRFFKKRKIIIIVIIILIATSLLLNTLKNSHSTEPRLTRTKDEIQLSSRVKEIIRIATDSIKSTKVRADESSYKSIKESPYKSAKKTTNKSVIDSTIESIKESRPDFDVDTDTFNTNCATGLQGGIVSWYNEMIYPFGALCKSCSSCALVVPSGHLLGSNAGQEIDNHECVFRMNGAPVKGYSTDVGNRTTINLISDSSVFLESGTLNQLLDDSDPELVLIWGLKTHKLREFARIAISQCQAAKKRCFSSEKPFVPEAMKDFEKYSGLNATWTSTGFFMVQIARQMCNRTSFFGLIPPDYCDSEKNRHKTTPYHYYKHSGIQDRIECAYMRFEEKRSAESLEIGHRFSAERLIYKSWTNLYNFSFYHPSWK